MSFGFSVGDFVAVGGLIVKSIDTLRNTQSEYQELIRELESLKRALNQVDKLKGRGDQPIAIDQIKCAALTCKYPLEQFLAKIQKYEKSLGLGKSIDKVRDAGRKIQYALGRKDEANMLRNYLNLHIGTINMLMLQEGLEKLDVASEQSEKNQEETKDGIEDCSRELKEVKGNGEAQVLAVRENNFIIHKLFWMVSGEIAAPLKTLSQTVAKVCVSTQQIYTIVLELKNNALGIDTRFTYFQAPVKVEDVLGRVFPFPSECSIEALDAEIEVRFRKGPGKIKVMAGDFELFSAKNAKQVLTYSDGNGLLPGMSINMAVVLEQKQKFAVGDKCPMPDCISRTSVEAVGGGRTCSDCHVWFDEATKKCKRGFEREERSKHVETLADPQHSEAERRKHSDSEENAISAFKRIRFGDSVPRRQENQQWTPQQLNDLMIRQQQRRQAEFNAQYQQGMQNGSPAQYQQARPVQQNPNQQPQAQQQAQYQSCIQMFHQALLKTLLIRHNGNEAAITQQEQDQARQSAVAKGKQYFTQHFQTQLQRQQQQIANMQAMGGFIPSPPT